MVNDRIGTTQIAGLLDSIGLRQYQISADGGGVLTGWRDDSGDTYQFVIIPVAGSSSLLLVVQRVLMAPPDEFSLEQLGSLLIAALAFNRRHLLGAWAYDNQHGEITFQLAVPVDDGVLTEATLRHCVAAVMQTVGHEAPRLRAVLDGSRTPRQVLDSGS
jgi:Putative bacterial sensory transduction regulator